MKFRLVFFMVFAICLLSIATGCTSGKTGDRLPLPSFGEVQNNSFPLKALTKVNGKLAWSDQSDLILPDAEGHYYAKSFVAFYSPKNFKMVCAHYLGNTAEIAAGIRATGSSVIGAVGWHDRYYLVEKASTGDVYFHELGEQPILSSRVLYDDFIDAAERFSGNSSNDLVSGGNGLTF